MAQRGQGGKRGIVSNHGQSPGGGESSLTPEDKAATIGVTNVAVGVFANVANSNGMRYTNGADEVVIGVPMSGSNRLLVLATLACFLPLVAKAVATAFANMNSTQSKTVNWLNRHLGSPGKATPVGLGYLLVITLLTYLAVTAVVFDSGGAVESPFSQFPIAVVVLAPIIMTGKRTPWVNLGLGAAYAGVLYYATEIPGLRDRVTSLPEGIRIQEWVYAAEAILIVVASLSFSVVRRSRAR